MYEHEHLDAHVVATLRAGIRRVLEADQHGQTILRALLAKQLTALKAKQANLIDLAAEGVLEWSQIRDRMNALQLDHARLEQRMEESGGRSAGRAWLP